MGSIPVAGAKNGMRLRCSPIPFFDSAYESNPAILLAKLLERAPYFFRYPCIKVDIFA